MIINYNMKLLHFQVVTPLMNGKHVLKETLPADILRKLPVVVGKVVFTVTAAEVGAASQRALLRGSVM